MQKIEAYKCRYCGQLFEYPDMCRAHCQICLERPYADRVVRKIWEKKWHSPKELSRI